MKESNVYKKKIISNISSLDKFLNHFFDKQYLRENFISKFKTYVKKLDDSSIKYLVDSGVENSINLVKWIINPVITKKFVTYDFENVTKMMFQWVEFGWSSFITKLFRRPTIILWLFMYYIKDIKLIRKIFQTSECVCTNQNIYEFKLSWGQLDLIFKRYFKPNWKSLNYTTSTEEWLKVKNNMPFFKVYDFIHFVNIRLHSNFKNLLSLTEINCKNIFSLINWGFLFKNKKISNIKKGTPIKSLPISYSKKLALIKHNLKYVEQILCIPKANWVNYHIDKNLILNLNSILKKKKLAFDKKSESIINRTFKNIWIYDAFDLERKSIKIVFSKFPTIGDFILANDIQIFKKLIKNDDFLKLFAAHKYLNHIYCEIGDKNSFDEKNNLMYLNYSIDRLELSVRSYNCLKRHGVNTLGELADMTKADASKIKNIGKSSIKELECILAAFGLCFKNK